MPDEYTIQVQGHGEVEAAPDIAVINLGVMSRESDAGASMQAASQRMHSVLEAVRRLGVPDRDIQSTGLNLFLDQQANVYMASQQVTVRTEDIGKAGAILDAAVQAGANASTGVGFSIDDPSALEDEALELAVADARRKAGRLAAALGVTVDRVERVEASSGGAAVPAFRRQSSAAVAQRAALPPMEAGQVVIAADVRVTYTFR
jgi:uncharacterized protein YggE